MNRKQYLWRNILTIIVISLFLGIETVNIIRYFNMNGNTAFIYYKELMIFLGPWNFLFSRPAVISEGIIPLLVIFASPVPVTILYIAFFRWMSRKLNIILSVIIPVIVVVLHLLVGVYWGFTNLSWGP